MAISIFQNVINKLTRSHRNSACTGAFGLVPLELLDLIISYLADDKATLLSCALVHRTWTSISRYYLRPLTLIVSSPSRAKELTKGLRSSRETLSASISGVTLVGEIPFHIDFSTNGRITKSCPPRAYSKLLHVIKAKHITLRLAAVENDISLVGLFAQYFPDLTALKVTCPFYHVCPSFQDIASFMTAVAGYFPRLAELSVELTSRSTDRPDVSTYGLRGLRPAMPCLRTLRVVGSNRELVRWLGENVAGTLERLELENVSFWSTCHVAAANLLVERNKETLRDVRMSFLRRHEVFDLSGLAHLETLEVTSEMGDNMSVTALTWYGWRLPRSLKRVVLRDARALILAGYCGCAGWVDAPGTLIEGEDLKRALGM